MIDLHSHILPGVDDGAQSLEESLEIARACVKDGIQLVAATPHVRDDYPTDAPTMEALVGELKDALAAARVPLEVRPGGEIAVDWLDRLAPDELRRFGLGGNPAYLLVEFPYYGFPLTLAERSFELSMLGITVVLAHPERNADVQGDPERLRAFVDSGVLVQVTAASVDGRLGQKAEETSFELVERGLAHLLGSDAHAAWLREAGMRAAAKAIGDRALARWLSHDVPAAIVSGAPLPRRPERPRRWFVGR